MAALVDRAEIGLTRRINYEVWSVDSVEETVIKQTVEAVLMMPRKQHEDPVAGQILGCFPPPRSAALGLRKEVVWHFACQFGKSQISYAAYSICKHDGVAFGDHCVGSSRVTKGFQCANIVLWPTQRFPIPGKARMRWKHQRMGKSQNL